MQKRTMERVQFGAIICVHKYYSKLEVQRYIYGYEGRPKPNLQLCFVSCTEQPCTKQESALLCSRLCLLLLASILYSIILLWCNSRVNASSAYVGRRRKLRYLYAILNYSALSSLDSIVRICLHSVSLSYRENTSYHVATGQSSQCTLNTVL